MKTYPSPRCPAVLLSIYDHRESEGLSCLRLTVNQHRYKSDSSRHTGKIKTWWNVSFTSVSILIESRAEMEMKMRKWEREGREKSKSPRSKFLKSGTNKYEFFDMVHFWLVQLAYYEKLKRVFESEKQILSYLRIFGKWEAVFFLATLWHHRPLTSQKNKRSECRSTWRAAFFLLALSSLHASQRQTNASQRQTHIFRWRGLRTQAQKVKSDSGKVSPSEFFWKWEAKFCSFKARTRERKFCCLVVSVVVVVRYKKKNFSP